MIIKYISFLTGIIWSYSIIKTQSVFKKETGIIFKIFITKISWLSLIATCYFGYKNFTIKSTIIGLIVCILLVNISFYLLKKYINQKFNTKQITIFKSIFEYSLVFLVIYFFFILKVLAACFLFLKHEFHHNHQCAVHQKKFEE